MAIKGMTIRIGGDTSGLTKAISDANKEIKSTQNELRDVNKLLKLDPTNTTLLQQRQKLLADQIGNTANKLNLLREKQKAFDETIKQGGNVSQEEYRKLEREIASTEKSLQDLKDQSKETNKTMENLAEGLKKVGEVAKNVAVAGLNITIAGVQALATACTGAITSLGAMAIKCGQMADDLNTLASQTGLSTKQLQEFAYASDLIDVSTETLAGSLKKLTSNMSNAKKGSGDVYDTFKALGVEFKNADGTLRNSNDVFNETIKALGNVANETERDAYAMKLFGKSATDLNPLIEGGIDTLAEMSEEANRLGLILSQEALDGANAFNDELDKIKAKGKGLFQVIGSEIASQLVPSMEAINEKANEVIKSLTDALQKDGLSGLAKELSKQFGNIVSELSKKLPDIVSFAIDVVKSLVDTIKENASQIRRSGCFGHYRIG